jgi:adenosylcobyric acid synthase
MPLLASSDWIILPGSKHTSGDLAWLRAQGLDAAVAAHAAKGGAVLGICGGLQMLGEALIDTHGIDGNAPGLGLLPLVTAFEPAKTLRRTQAIFADGLHGVWAPLAGLAVSGYEIHQGQTQRHPAFTPGAATEVLPGGLGWQDAGGKVLGVYLHGLFEDAGVLKALFGAYGSSLDVVFDGLADFISCHFDADALDALLSSD